MGCKSDTIEKICNRKRKDMSKLKCAVIGTGYLGKFHAEKYASLPDCE
ncbi:MAG: hypothetical protein GQ529_12645, partial [Methyloprofundus sp.]|nr:hypothetical protein [Methyloprofundus sp.]